MYKTVLLDSVNKPELKHAHKLSHQTSWRLITPKQVFTLELEHAAYMCVFVCLPPLCLCVFRKPADLQNLAPGTHPPFITYNGEVKTDVNKIEEFLEDVLSPPK